MKNKCKPYTTGDIKIMKQMRASGSTDEEIAEKLERTIYGIKSAFKNFKLTKPKYIMSEFEKSLVMSCDTPMNISRIIGVDNCKIALARYRMKRAGRKIIGVKA
jgi:hypothetical protein